MFPEWHIKKRTLCTCVSLIDEQEDDTINNKKLFLSHYNCLYKKTTTAIYMCNIYDSISLSVYQETTNPYTILIIINAFSSFCIHSKSSLLSKTELFYIYIFL